MKIRLCRARTECENMGCRERAVFTLETGCAPWQTAHLCPDCLRKLRELCGEALQELGLYKEENKHGE